MGCVFGKLFSFYELFFESIRIKNTTTVDEDDNCTLIDKNMNNVTEESNKDVQEKNNQKLKREISEILTCGNCNSAGDAMVCEHAEISKCDDSDTSTTGSKWQKSDRPIVISTGNKLEDSDCEELDNHDEFIIENTFEDLLSRCPSNVVIKILEYVPFHDLVHNVSLVSKTWHSMAFDPSLWCILDLRYYVINDVVLRKLPQICSFIRYVVFPDAKNDDLTDVGMMALAVGCPNLTTFYAPRSGSKYSEDAFIAFAEHCPVLKKLSLDCLDITDRTLHSISLHLHQLEYLSICQVSTITNEGVAEIIKKCRNLQALLVNQNHQITEDSLQTIPESSKSLKRLDLMMCRVHHTGVPIIGELNNLEHVNLSQCKELTSEYLTPVLNGCRNLRLLSLNLDKKIDDSSVDVIFNYLPGLEQIYLVSTEITDKALDIMGRKGKKLFRIDIGYTKVTGEGAHKISELCTTLRYLGLMRCDKIPESIVEELVVQYPNITYSTFIQDTKRLLRKAELEDLGLL